MAEVEDNLEWSLPVPNVQELSSQRLETVPSRYIRDDMDLITTTDSSLHVPLIDMAKLVNPQSQQAELQNLHYAFKEWGLFQLIHHGVPDETLMNMKKQVQEFFNLPLTEKNRWAQKRGSIEGFGQAFVTSEEQKLDWNDMLFLYTLPVQTRNLSFWPDQPSSFRETTVSYAEDIRKLVVSIFRYIALALKLDAEEISSSYEEGYYSMRFNCYPPCPVPERVIGIVPHADISGITMLLDCGNTPGLQVQKDEKWVSVEPIDGAIVVNAGNILEIISNGMYKAPYHRAVVNREMQRISVAMFCYPNSAGFIGPARQLTSSENIPLYKTVTHEEYFRYFSNWKLDGRFVDLLKI